MSTAAASRLGDLRAGVAAHLRAFLREPLHVALLVALPPLVVEAYGRAMASFPELPFMSTVPATLGRINGAVFAAAFLAGLIGLFQVISAAEADRRLVVAGLGRLPLFASRLVTVLVVSVVAAALPFAALAWQITPEAPVAAFGALVLGAVTYGLVGVLIGAVVPRELEGSLVLVFVADMDDALASGIVDVDSPVTDLTPLHYPHDLFQTAVLEGAPATGDVLAGVAYVGVLLVAVAAVYVARVAPGGDLS